ERGSHHGGAPRWKEHRGPPSLRGRGNAGGLCREGSVTRRVIPDGQELAQPAALRRTEMRKPYLGSAAVVSRMVSKLLKEHGWHRANTRNKFYWTEGFYVLRVGSGKKVHVDYHVAHDQPDRGNTQIRFSKRAQIRELLFELGYVSSHPTAIYIECQNL